MSSVREQQVLDKFEDDEVIYVRGRIDWELLDDGREPPADIGNDIAVTAIVNAQGQVLDIIDMDFA